MRSLIGIEDFSKSEIDELIDVAKDIMENREEYSNLCKGKILATLFFEPSTRTRLSFESAMLSLGGNIIGFSSADNTSTAKGESLADTIRVVSGYSDIIAMRHPKEGAPLVASMNSNVPIINAGDGGHNHPTQTLLDLLTISIEKGSINNLTVGLCGDLKYGRTVHSLVTALSMYKNIEFIFISPDELKMPEYIKNDILNKKNIKYVETNDLESSIAKLDILYMTRIQKERFSDESEYERLKNVYILDKEKMNLAKSDLCVMHPLPRVNEISTEFDNDPRACYFKQAENGRYMRMAIILKLLGILNKKIKLDDNKQVINRFQIFNPILTTSKITVSANNENSMFKCANSRCITTVERGLKQWYVYNENKICRCKYCEAEVNLI